MNEKGRQTKLLAAIAIIAMVVCAFAVIMPSASVDAVDIASDDVTSFDDTSGAVSAAADTVYVVDGAHSTNGLTMAQTNTIVLMLPGSSLKITGADSTTVTVYPATAVAGTQAGTVDHYTYNTADAIIFDGAASSGVTLTNTNGVITGDGATLAPTNAITYVESSGATVEYMLSVPEGGISVFDGNTITIPAAFSQNITVNGSVHDDVTDTDSRNNTLVITDDMTTESRTTAITIVGGADGALTISGTADAHTDVAVTYGQASVDGSTPLTIAPENLSAVINAINIIATSVPVSTVMYADLKETQDEAWLQIYNKAFNQSLTMINGTTLYVGAGGSYSGTITSAVFADNGSDTRNYYSYTTDITVELSAGSTITQSNAGFAVTGTAVNSGTVVNDSSALIMGIIVETEKTGSPTDDADLEKVTVNNAALGSMNLGYPVTVAANSALVIPEGYTLVFSEGGSIVAANNTTSSVYVIGNLRSDVAITSTGFITGFGVGTVHAMRVGEANTYMPEGTGAVAISDSDNRIQISVASGSEDAAVQSLLNADSGTFIELTGGSTDPAKPTVLNFSGVVDLTGLDIEIPADTYINFNFGTVKSDGTTDRSASVNLTNMTINSNETGSKIVVNAGSNLYVENSKLFIVVNESEGASVEYHNENVVYENTSSNVSVGAGTTLTLTGNVSSVVGVYGNLVIESTATVPDGTKMTVYEGGSVTVNGTLNIYGEAEFQPGSTGTINGTVVVGEYSVGGSVLDVDGNFTIGTDGTVRIESVEANNYYRNKLEAPTPTYKAGEGYDNIFEVLGTLNMSGEFTGTIADRGTINFNGYTTGTATIIVYQDVSLTVTSVGGSLNVIDTGIMDEELIGNNMQVSHGNMVTLTNVNGVTINETVETVAYTDSSNQNHIDYVTVMGISGTAGATNGGTVTIGVDNTTGATIRAQVGDEKQQAYVTVAADTTLVFGDMVNLSVGANELMVAGEVSFLKSDNDDTKKISGNGTITVTGEMNVYNGAMGVSKVNAAQYIVTVSGANPSVTETYTNFAAAVLAAPDADNDRVTVMGSITADQTVEVPSGVTVNMSNNALLTIADGVTVTMPADSKLNGGATANIEVEGTLTVRDVDEVLGLSENNIHSDVVIDQDPAKTWTSLGNALDMGMTEITLNRDIVIDEDTVIPDGTTVSTQYGVTVDDATLTVDGTLQMTPGRESEGKLDTINGGAIDTNGVVSVQVQNTENIPSDEFLKMDAVVFALRSGAYTTVYASNLTYAAETVSNNNTLVSDANGNNVFIIGSVGAGDITFAAPENRPIRIDTVDQADKPAVISFGTMTLTGNVVIDVDSNARITGSITALCGDGTVSAAVSMDTVQGIAVEASYSIGATGTEYTLSVGSAGYVGDITVTAGTVTLKDTTVTAGSSMTIDSGATVVIPSNAKLTVMNADSNGTVPVLVEGILTVRNGAGIAVAATNASTFIEVTGTMNIDVRSITLPVGLEIRNAGTVAVGEGNTMTVNGTIVLGDAPAIVGGSASGTITGSIYLGNGAYIVAYNGTDLDDATVNWNAGLSQSMANTTTYNINGSAYATVYAISDVTIGTVFSENGRSIDITGYDSEYFWYASQDEADRANEQNTGNVNSQAIGRYADVYAEFDLSQIRGTVSKDAGIILTIDDMVVGYGNGDVSQTISYPLSVGTHTVAWSERTGYDISDVTVTFNGVAVENGGTITITPEMTSYTIIAQGAVPGAAPGGSTGSSDDGLGLTDYLLIVLVILIVVMAIMVALRLMRS